MTVLTQDQSRQFLASASPKDKYTVRLPPSPLLLPSLIRTNCSRSSSSAALNSPN